MTTRSRTAALTLTVLLLTACRPADPAPAGPTPPAPSGNGIETLGAAEILSRTRAAFASAGSYRFDGCRGTEGPRACAEYQATGDDFIGRLRALDGTAEILAVDGRHYMRPDEKMWDQLLESVTAEQKSNMLERAGDNWIETQAGGDSFGARFDRADLVADLDAIEEVTMGAQTEVDGRPAFTLGTADGSLIVATTGEPYPLRWGLDASSVTLSGFGATFPPVQAPPADQVVSLADVIAAVDGPGA
ncbi:hypothetical protein Ait01nite_054360 [Actinoplanes italicus]|uniref:Lipoprotein n=1 Tax=Actinoplanes italicus TaxID=113567 RepID=A0A2T0K7N0_9ACTN|nr:hypothetical protein [Actinoplanes italicus]PRX19030.1 hypothetical protein CLV67_111178 [Actinoplanes italicus]GIE32391.1 hypothetical protein Ait01nite_054360 [Actinoplanes italicus]